MESDGVLLCSTLFACQEISKSHTDNNLVNLKERKNTY